MFQTFCRLFGDTRGATAIEYGLIAGLISMAAIGAMTNFGTTLDLFLVGASGVIVQATQAGTP